MVTAIHNQGAKIVIALTHLSMREDKKVARCANVDPIIGGHEHTLLESSAGRAPIFKMTANARELGRIDLNISKIVQLKVNGQPVSPSRKYSLATTTFVALDGGDGYAMLMMGLYLRLPIRTPLDSDALRRALIGRAIAPKIEGRIQPLDKSPATRTECE